jgi:O-antigen ligase
MTIIIFCILCNFCLRSYIGFILSVFIGVFCIFIAIKNFRRDNRLSGKVSIALALAFILATFAFYQYDKKYEGKLYNLKNDIIISFDIDKNQTWSRSTSIVGVPDPVDQNGRTVNGSTYERTSWFIKGLYILVDHPLGSGFSWLAFGHYMSVEYPGSNVKKTHSGWLDFALGVGLPGLFLTWLAIFLILREAFVQLRAPYNNDKSFIIIFFLSGMSFFWIVSEVCKREYIESFFFFIALSSSYLSSIKNHLENPTFYIK